METRQKKSLFFCFFLFLFVQTMGQINTRGVKVDSENAPNPDLQYANKYAILIGIDSYDSKSGFSPLNYAANDAIALKNLLIQKCGFPAKNVKILINKEASREKILNALDDYSKEGISENSQLLVFFAGHGTTTGRNSNKRRGFLVPVDGDEEKLVSTAISMEELRNQSESFKSKHVLFLVDACYGGLAQSREGKGQFSKAFIKNVWSQKGSEIITAGSADETVLEAAEWQHSAFTKVLLDGIEKEEADTNNDGVLVTSELYGYIQQRVPYYAQQKGGKQTPQLDKFTVEGGTFLLELTPNALSIGKIQNLVPEEKDIKKKLNSRINITSNVYNARVKIQDKEVGSIINNSFLFDLAPGFYKVEVLKEKFDPLIKEIEIFPDTTQVIQFNLTQNIFNLKINVSPDEAVLFINDKLVGAGSNVKELEKGRQSVKIEKTGYIAHNQIIDVLKDTTLNIKLEQIKGSVEINTVPNEATVKIDGVDSGNSPLKFDLGFGKHEIEISKNDYLSKKVALEVTEPIKIAQNIRLDLNPSGQAAQKIVLDYWNKKFLSNIGLSAISMLGYLYFDSAVKKNIQNTTFANKEENKNSRSFLQTGKYACLVFGGMELINSAFCLQKSLMLQKKKNHSVAININVQIFNQRLSLCVNL